MTMPEGASTPEPGDNRPGGLSGLAADASTLAATGLLVASAFAIAAGVLNALDSTGVTDLRDRLLKLTYPVDIQDVALLGVAVVLLLVTPDPHGGFNRNVLLRIGAVLSGVVSLFGIVRALVVMTGSGAMLGRFAQFIAVLGVALAAATVTYYAATEKPMYPEGHLPTDH
jgi:hypothetical protein